MNAYTCIYKLHKTHPIYFSMIYSTTCMYIYWFTIAPKQNGYTFLHEDLWIICRTWVTSLLAFTVYIRFLSNLVPKMHVSHLYAQSYTRACQRMHASKWGRLDALSSSTFSGSRAQNAFYYLRVWRRKCCIIRLRTANAFGSKLAPTKLFQQSETNSDGKTRIFFARRTFFFIDWPTSLAAHAWLIGRYHLIMYNIIGLCHSL
jgi:hypothetical protein